MLLSRTFIFTDGATKSRYPEINKFLQVIIKEVNFHKETSG